MCAAVRKRHRVGVHHEVQHRGGVACARAHRHGAQDSAHRPAASTHHRSPMGRPLSTAFPLSSARTAHVQLPAPAGGSVPLVVGPHCPLPLAPVAPGPRWPWSPSPLALVAPCSVAPGLVAPVPVANPHPGGLYGSPSLSLPARCGPSVSGISSRLPLRPVAGSVASCSPYLPTCRGDHSGSSRSGQKQICVTGTYRHHYNGRACPA